MRVKEMREENIRKFAERNNGDIATARKISNSFYRLCGLADRNMHLANDERTCNLRSTAMSEEREQRWIDRLNKQLKPFNAHISYHGSCPSIVEYTNEFGGVAEVFERFFY